MAGMDPVAYFKAIQFIEQLDGRYETNQQVGWVYVMRNEELQKRLLKIGMTRRPPDQRASEMGTGVPGRFELVHFVNVCDARAAEQYVHETLTQHQYREDREFFMVGIGTAVRALDRAAEVFPLLRSMRNKGNRNPRSKPIPQAFPVELRACRACGQKNRARALAIPIRLSCGKCGQKLG